MKRVAAVLLGAACVSAGPSVPAPDVGQGDVETARALGSRFDSLRLSLRIPGLAVVVLRDTSVLLARGFGFANVERQIPVTPETPFNTASVSKPISAVVALRLAQDGLLDLDRPMRRYADFAEFCTAARGDGGTFFGDYACTDDRLTLRHVLSMSANGDQPGTRFWYNPPSYSWASRPIAEMAGRPFSELVDSLVFRPAGMRNAARTHRRLPLPPRIAEALATPYHIDSAGRVMKSDPPPPQGDGAAGGVTAAAMDLARFDIALTNGRLLTPASRAALWSPTRTPSGQVLPYGLGWFLGSLPRPARGLAHRTLGRAVLGALPQGARGHARPAAHPDPARQQRQASMGDALRRGCDRALAIRQGVLRYVQVGACS